MSDETLSNKQMDRAMEISEAHTQAVIAAHMPTERKAMLMKVTITKSEKIVFTENYAVSVEGDLQNAVADAMSKARANVGFGANWDFSIHVDRA